MFPQKCFFEAPFNLDARARGRFFALKWTLLRLTSVLGPVSRKPRKLFGPGQPFLIVCILKTKRHIGMKLYMKGNFVRIKNMSKEQLSKLKV